MSAVNTIILMSNKKQIHLKTIQLDLCFVPPDSPSYSGPPENSKSALLMTSTSHRRPVHSNSNLISSSTSKIKSYKPVKKQSFLLSRLQQLQINQYKVDKYVPSRFIRQNASYYQQFPKRESPIKNTNPFKFFLNSATAVKNYSESIAPLEKIQLKLSEISLRKSSSRPVTGKMTSKSQHIGQLLQKNKKEKRPVSSSLRQSLERKRQKCVTAPTIDPWQTTQEKYLTEW